MPARAKAAPKDSTATIGIEADFGPEHADTFRRDLHPDLRTDTATRVSAKPRPRSHLAGLLRSERQLLANPPFNDSDTALRDSARHDREAIPQVVRGAKDSWSKDDDVRVFSLSASNGERAGVRCRNPLTPPKGNANFAWVQHFIHHLAPQGMSSNQSGEGEIRRALIEADRGMPSDEMRTTNRSLPTSTFEIHPSNFTSLPGQLFYITQIPVCLWFPAKNKAAGKCRAVSELELTLAA